MRVGVPDPGEDLERAGQVELREVRKEQQADLGAAGGGVGGGGGLGAGGVAGPKLGRLVLAGQHEADAAAHAVQHLVVGVAMGGVRVVRSVVPAVRRQALGAHGGQDLVLLGGR